MSKPRDRAPTEAEITALSDAQVRAVGLLMELSSIIDGERLTIADLALALPLAVESGWGTLWVTLKMASEAVRIAAAGRDGVS